MAELDHIVFASPDVEAGVARIETLTGVRAVVGGQHIGRGTHNSLLTFDDRTYFEIIGADPDQPKPERPRGFGLDDLNAPKLVAYAIHPTGNETLEDLASVIRAHGFDPGSMIDMSRQKPDGDLLAWRLATGGDTAHGLSGAVPFAIDWLGAPSPATSLPSMGHLQRLVVQHDDPRVAGLVEALGLADSVDVVAGPPGLSVTMTSLTGETLHLP